MLHLLLKATTMKKSFQFGFPSKSTKELMLLPMRKVYVLHLGGFIILLSKFPEHNNNFETLIQGQISELLPRKFPEHNNNVETPIRGQISELLLGKFLKHNNNMETLIQRQISELLGLLLDQIKYRPFVPK